MKSPEHLTTTTEITEKPKPAWSKPTIRVMTVNFTQNSYGSRVRPSEDDDHPVGNVQYIPQS